jgi:hypothetical protein
MDDTWWQRARRGTGLLRSPRLSAERAASRFGVALLPQTPQDPVIHLLLLAIDALGVDLQKDVHRVTGASRHTTPIRSPWHRGCWSTGRQAPIRFGVSSSTALNAGRETRTPVRLSCTRRRMRVTTCRYVATLRPRGGRCPRGRRLDQVMPLARSSGTTNSPSTTTLSIKAPSTWRNRRSWRRTSATAVHAGCGNPPWLQH